MQSTPLIPGSNSAADRVQLVPIVVGLQNLLLDPNNYRLEERTAGSKVADSEVVRLQPKLIERMFNEYEAEALAVLIQDHGWLDHDRIVVRRLEQRSTNGNRPPGITSSAVPLFVVVEGNRRTSALKWLFGNAPYQSLKPSVQKAFNGLNVTLLEGLPDDVRELANTIMGLRHIKMVLPWGARQRDRFVADLYENSNLSFTQIGKRLSEGARKTKGRYRAWRMFEQAADPWRKFEDELRQAREAGPDSNKEEVESEQQKVESELRKVKKRLYHLLGMISANARLRTWLGWRDGDTRSSDGGRRMAGVPSSGSGHDRFRALVSLILSGTFHNPDQVKALIEIASNVQALHRFDIAWDLEDAGLILQAANALKDLHKSLGTLRKARVILDELVALDSATLKERTSSLTSLLGEVESLRSAASKVLDAAQ